MESSIMEKGRRTLSYEDLLSGRGHDRIYRFLREKASLPETRFTRQIDEAREKAPLISQYVGQDETCREAFRCFSIYTPSVPGISPWIPFPGGNLPGGRHPGQEPLPYRHFEENDRHPEILQAIPIRVINNYDVSLLGAAFAASLPGVEGRRGRG
jgi:glucokinase